jgi:general secretion pathway protein L
MSPKCIWPATNCRRGITRDAPSLIPLIEQSQHFRRATFYAPTTRAPSDPGERFHIETRVEPRNTAAPW